jgi:hypothetical protein
MSPPSPVSKNKSRIRVLLAICFMLVSCLAYSSTLKIEVTCSYKMSVDFQRTTRCYVPQDRTLCSICGSRFPRRWVIAPYVLLGGYQHYGEACRVILSEMLVISYKNIRSHYPEDHSLSFIGLCDVRSSITPNIQGCE